MSDEQLRAAAERLVHQWDNHDNYRHIAGEDNSEPVAVSLARAYLAEHADAPANQPAGAEASGCEPVAWAIIDEIGGALEDDDGNDTDMLIFKDEALADASMQIAAIKKTPLVKVPLYRHPAPASELAELRKCPTCEGLYAPAAMVSDDECKPCFDARDIVKRGAELRAEVERLREDAIDRDKAWQEKIATIVGNARKQVATLTTRAETAERERDAMREACQFFIAGYDKGCMASTDPSVPNVGHGVRLIRAALAPTGDAANAE